MAEGLDRRDLSTPPQSLPLLRTAVEMTSAMDARSILTPLHLPFASLTKTQQLSPTPARAPASPMTKVRSPPAEHEKTSCLLPPVGRLLSAGLGWAVLSAESQE